MGFFLHIPWPPADVFFALPPHEELIRAMASYDLVGFQTQFDAENFASCVMREGMGRRVGDKIYDAYGRVFRIGAFPISIDTAKIADLALAADNNSIVKRLDRSLEGRKLVVGVDRLDYSKGITHRIEAFSRFMESSPENRGQVVYLQVTPKSRSDVPEYAEQQKQVAELAGRVNGALGDVDWTPIRYINRSLGRAALAGTYRLADVGLITPLRDGMNLVAKEYVASQNPDDPGVLILSSFAGAARELDGAILVNPYDLDDIAAALARALAMPREERVARWRGMFARLHRHDVGHWCEGFLDILGDVREGSVLAAAS
jgi:trehalose 6-phosphate synthase